jgi:4a-hydroxytetrahydrobiopterin dehydratase
MTALTEKKCIPCEGGVPPLTTTEAQKLLAQLNEWTLNEQAHEITKKFVFKNFYHTMSFVNAVAWIANQENHHPDLKVGYNFCHIFYKTHAINGLSENDFICAAKIDELIRSY